MGFWNRLFGKPKSDATATAEGNHSDLLVDALIRTLAYVAASDGTLDEREITEISHIYAELMGTSVEPGLIRQAVELAEQDTQSLQVFLQDAASRLQSSDVRLIIEGAAKVARANNDIDAAEARLIDHIATSLNFPGAEAQKMLSDLKKG